MSLLLRNQPMASHAHWENFTEADHKTWSILFDRQTQILKERAADEIMEGIEKLKICSDQIPQFPKLNAILEKETGFSVVPVTGLVPDDIFFRLLAERQFPSTCFIRKPYQLDYLEEPDIFHDVFGHVPLLVDPVFADFMQQFGKKGLEAIEAGMLELVATLYWFTVEFGLIASNDTLRIYGAGITSSKTESIYCLASEIPVRVKFDVHRIMRTQYHTDSLQKTYFVIESFQQLFDTLKQLNWAEVRETWPLFPEIKQGVVINEQEKHN